jgi:hypothetical protein
MSVEPEPANVSSTIAGITCLRDGQQLAYLDVVKAVDRGKK